MNKLTEIRQRFDAAYLTPQDKRWRRIMDAASALLCFVSAAIALYLLETQASAGPLKLLTTVSWGYLATTLPLAYLLYKPPALLKIERFVLTLFLLLSGMSLMLSILTVLMMK